METVGWLFLGMIAITVTVLACGDAQGTREGKGEEFDDFVELEAANARVTTNLGIFGTLGSMAKTFSRQRNQGNSLPEMGFHISTEVANQDMVDFWFNQANPMYWAVHSAEDLDVKHDD